jgi:hypothetical protein
MEDAYAAAGVTRFAAWVHETDTALRRAIERRGYRLDQSTRAMAILSRDDERGTMSVEVQRGQIGRFLMRLVRLLAAVAVFAFAAIGGAQAHPGAGISGGGTLGPPYTGPFSDIQSATFQLSVHEDASGVSGFVAFTYVPKPGLAYDASLDLTADVDCVSVQPVQGVTAAVFAGAVRRVDPAPNAFNVVAGQRIFFLVTDGGSPPGTVDSFYWSPGDEHPDECNEQLALYPPIPPDVAQGNIVIR